MKDQINTLPVLDIYQAVLLVMKGHRVSLGREGGRVIFEFSATGDLFRHISEYQRDPAISVLSFVAISRRFHSQMISACDKP